MANLMVIVAYTINTGDDPAVGLALADIDLYLTAIHRNTGVDTVIWDGTQHPTFEIDNVGAYGRILPTGDLETYNYVGGGLYTGIVAVDAEWVVGEAGRVEASPAEVAAALLAHSIITSALKGCTDLSLYRGDTWTQVITGMGDLTAATDIWFAVKADPSDTDDEALVLISQSAGLERINGAAAAAPGNGSIAVVGAATAGMIQIDLDEAETAKLAPDKRFWDCQKLVGGRVTTPKGGRLIVQADIARVVV
jgi:hypothetical protein